MKNFFKIIWLWIVSIFKDNHIVPIPAGEDKEEENPPKFFRSRKPKTASHNNRKPTKGRNRQQVIYCKNKEIRTIFHQI